MMRSMTGFGKVEVNHEGNSCNIELRSVNHRFLDLKIKLPEEYHDLEEKLKRKVKKVLSRGKIDIQISMNDLGASPPLQFDQKVLQHTKSILQALETEFNKELQINFSDLMHINGLLKYEAEVSDKTAVEMLFEKVVDAGLKSLNQMRVKEGKLIQDQVLDHISICENHINKVPEFSKEVIEVYKRRLQRNLEHFDLVIDHKDPRLIQEIGIIIDRCDVTEEVNRFKAHIIHVRELLNQDIPVGRKLDFLMQELNREANTLCSKGTNTEIAIIGVELKSEIEKIREQIQNVE